MNKNGFEVILLEMSINRQIEETKTIIGGMFIIYDKIEVLKNKGKNIDNTDLNIILDTMLAYYVKLNNIKNGLIKYEDVDFKEHLELMNTVYDKI